MDADITFMAMKLEQTSGAIAQQDRIKSAVQEALARPKRVSVTCQHNKPEKFYAGQAIDIQMAAEKIPKSVRLFYRHVNQGERYQTSDMQLAGKSYTATIPATYTHSKYAIEYYFELRESPEAAWLYPGFNKDLANQPYFIVRQA